MWGVDLFMLCWLGCSLLVCLWCGGLFMVWWFVYGVVVWGEGVRLLEQCQCGVDVLGW